MTLHHGILALLLCPLLGAAHKKLHLHRDGRTRRAHTSGRTPAGGGASITSRLLAAGPPTAHLGDGCGTFHL